MAKPEKTVAQLLEDLKAGDTLLVQAVRTKTDKIQLELAEKLGGDDTVNLLQVFNADDDRFKRSARRAWLTSTVAQAAIHFNLNFGDDADWKVDASTGKETLELGILNPTIMEGKIRLRVQVTETTTPTAYQAENSDTAAKRKGKDGDFITCKGKRIYSNTTVVPCKVGMEPTHLLLQADVDVVPVSGIAEIVDETRM